jgi:hypothetical protein
MKTRALISVLIALLVLPALACQTILGALGAGATPTPFVPELPTLDLDLEVTVEVPDVATALPGATLPALPTFEVDGEVPEDIPVVEPNENLVTSAGLVSYETGTDFSTVLEFYKDEMPANGWEESLDALEFGETAILNYTKEGQTAVVTLSVSGGKTVVLIALGEQ